MVFEPHADAYLRYRFLIYQVVFLLKDHLVTFFSLPTLKFLVKKRWLSSILFKSAAKPSVIKKILYQAYPTKNNVDDALINILLKPSSRNGAGEAFRGFINIFDDHLAPNLIKDIKIPVNLIWGENDPWEPINEAKIWLSKYDSIKSLKIINNAGHCPHDEYPEKVNKELLNLIQHAT